MHALSSQDVGKNVCEALHCGILLFVPHDEMEAILFYEMCSFVVTV